MPHSNAQWLRAWQRTPLMTRVVILADSLLDSEQPGVGIQKLIALVSVLSTCVDGKTRACIVEQLRAEADLLTPPDRRSLH